MKPGLLLLALSCAALSLSADEIRLKDGKKLYGVIVAYEENMFKVKTDFGYVLVEKDKIASIIPTAPPLSPEAPPSKNGTDGKPTPNAQPKPDPPKSSASDATPNAASINAKTSVSAPTKNDNAGKVTNAAVKQPVAPAPGGPQVAASATRAGGQAAGVSTGAPNATPAAVVAAPPKEPEVPAIREDVQGNLYTNHTYGFRMYKAPSWQLIDNARNALPNAIVAMGTSDESTLMVIGREKTKESLDAAAATVEKRLREVYEGYWQTSQRKTTLGGAPAIEYRYRGRADEHDWSGTLVVIARGTDVFTVLGMTYANSDLIQIQENVIAKAVASLSFDAH